jgi:hypothetical protein
MLGLTGSSGATSALLAFADDTEKNLDAVALSPTVGWLMLLGAVALFALLALNAERWRRWWLQREDPRSIGMYRIVFGFFVICNMNDFWEYFHFLFTDEGIFTADVARQVHASAQFAGFGDGFTEDSPWGFFDFDAVIEFLKGPKYSLLYFWDTPEFFWGHLWVFELCAALFMLGLWTRITGVMTLFLMNSIFFRNHLFWEGTELVYRVFLIYLLCAKSGHAYSIDNWLRCRALRKQGLLSEPGLPGEGAGAHPSDEHPRGLQAMYRLIPAWPRRLMLLQLGCVYAFTGIVKNGSVWAKGDAIYYAWNLDHFYRFYPQKITALTGTNLMRLATWQAHWGEAFFATCLLGIFYWWAKAEGFRPAMGVRKFGIRACLGVLVYVAAALVWVTWPVHYTPNLATAGGRGVMVGLLVGICAVGWWVFIGPRVHKRGPRLAAIAAIAAVAAVVFVQWPNAPRGGIASDIFSRRVFVVAFPALLLTLWQVWVKLGRDPIEINSILRIRKLKTPVVIDRDWVMKWVFGRRIWITWHVQLMGGIFILMNIGQFQTAMLSQTFLFFTGLEIAQFGRFLGRKAPRWIPGIPKAIREGAPAIPSEDPTLPYLPRDEVRFPQWAVWATALGVLAGILIKVQYDPEWWHQVWLGTLLFAAGVAFQCQRAARRRPRPDESSRASQAAAARLQMLARVWGLLSLLDMVAIFALLWWQRSAISFVLIAPAAVGLLYTAWRAHQLSARAFGVAGFIEPRLEQLSAEDPDSGRPRAPWAYGPAGRFIVGGLVVWHISAVTVWVTPDKDSMEAWRPKARKIFAKYLTITQTDQGWGMFAPNPPRSNVFLKVLVTDANGEVFDMKSDVYAPERKPIPWIWNDRMRKMNRRIIGGESGDTQWYRKWYARWQCRDWQLTHNGEMPDKVELVKVWYKIPSPEEVAKKGWYQPEELYEKTKTEKVEHTEKCARTVMGQLPNHLRERHGLPPLPENTPYKPWLKHKKKKWDKRDEEKETPEQREARLAKEKEEKVQQAAERRKAAAAARAQKAGAE